MDRNAILELLNQHCRFRLKSGKEIYGVIWSMKQHEGHNEEYYFASSGAVSNYLVNAQESVPPPNIGYPVKLEEVIFAERI